jgi:transcriptional regulator with XRE-family HTH domain
MDENWFRARKKQAGVTDQDIADKIRRDRSVVSKIVHGGQKMSLEWARAFAEVLQVPIEEVLAQVETQDAPMSLAFDAPARPSRGFSEPDATPFDGQPAVETDSVAKALGKRPGVDLWLVRNGAMASAGLLPGDLMLVDTHQAERLRPGDVVVAQIYNNLRGTAQTVLRRWLPPVVVSCPGAGETQSASVVDGINVLVRGKVTASWRTR